MRKLIHKAPPFTELPLRAVCGAGPGVVMSIDGREICEECKEVKKKRVAKVQIPAFVQMKKKKVQR